MTVASTSVDRRARTATVHVHGDIVIKTTPAFYDELEHAVHRADVSRIVIDFEDAGRVDSSGLAAVSLARRVGTRDGKTLQLEHLHDRQRAVLALVPAAPLAAVEDTTRAGWFEVIGRHVLAVTASLRGVAAMIADAARQAAAVVTRRARLPAGATTRLIGMMGVDALPIVGLLALMIGVTLAFQGAIFLQRFGAGVFIGDLTGVTTVREFAPLITAIILTGRTGAAIAAELGTMRVRGELDALTAMGVSPIRFLLLPRLIALTVVQPALTLMAMFIGVGGGMLVAAAVLHLPASVFWARILDRVELVDFYHGIGKSFAFAWIIGLTGGFFGMRARADASSVGAATTRSVVVGVSLIILVDAIVAMLAAMTHAKVDTW
jgi:phospholipid/cholesterol/gamma-HCH transport system permease protein